VLDDRQIVGAGELHGAAHDASAHHRQAIIGNGDRSGRLHGADGGKLFAGAPLVMAPMGNTLTGARRRARSTM